ncbi:MAG: acyl-CoA dehydrogenase [Alphaproteobacteria bacterium]|nr:acyl-CoA dehydrogenase [Alphaproteobacteria bacterium]MBT4019050.1 acyl-CoA dehydrogenase [Alphaproteobacteria bacterium]MBT4966496.1 acyl-CoA dehydrogenase [Alphaproteobacteria bacterium]MBT5919910.1 acyl-CoA dehydrogenase [Alphaproteobacteria bacterium]MBT6385930.1 acyl-CoA dehydrogenase [Alphaproteobacteria bacterium]
MAFEISVDAAHLRDRVRVFMADHVFPMEEEWDGLLEAGGDRWQPVAKMEELKGLAKEEGLWNLFSPDDQYGAGLSNVDYAYICEEMGRSFIGPEVFNCSAPDTGNMEVLAQYGTDAHKDKWLTPLLAGDIRSAFSMTEPDVASSDATNIATTIKRDGDDYVINGRKWWTSGVADQRCKIIILMGRSFGATEASRHQQHSMILVPKDTAGLEIVRNLTVFGYDHAPNGHSELRLNDVRVPKENMLLGEGRGFEIAQGRLGPGRVHHCMRAIGAAERALEIMCARAANRVAFGKPLHQHGMVRHDISLSRIEIDQARLLTLHAAHMMDTVGNQAARKEISMIKVAAMSMACKVIDRAIQVHGAAGVSQDTFLAHAWSWNRAIRMGDGPDEVHLDSIARQEMKSFLQDGKKQ